MIRAFRSTLEDLNDRRSMHSLHSLRSPRTGIPPASGSGIHHPLYNLNLLNPNYSSSKQSQPQPHAPNASLPSDISYIDEDPQQQQQRNLQNGRTNSASNPASPPISSSSSSTAGGFTDVVHSLQQKNGQSETRI